MEVAETIIPGVNDDREKEKVDQLVRKDDAPFYPENAWRGVEKVGDYILGEELGRGGQGIVYKAVDAEGNEVALKFPLSKEGVSDMILEAMRAELFKKFDSEFLRVYQADGWVQSPFSPDNPEAKVPYIILNLSQKGSLADVLDDRPLSYADAGMHIAQIADAITAMHDEGFLHRDIKSENVLVYDGEEGEVPEAHVTDFGISSTIEAGKNPVFEIIGSPPFVA